MFLVFNEWLKYCFFVVFVVVVVAGGGGEWMRRSEDSKFTSSCQMAIILNYVVDGARLVNYGFY